MPVFPQDPDFLINEILNSEKDDFTISVLNTGLHAGTHLDAPYHFYPSGRKIHEIPLNELMGPSTMIRVENSSRKSSLFSDLGPNTEYSTIKIEASAFKSVEKGDMIILRTNWSLNWGSDRYFTHNPYLSEKAANFLVEKEIRGLAIDGPSIDKFGETIIHEKLLSNDIWIVENLKNLDCIPELKNEESNELDINITNNNNNSFEFFFIPLPLKTEASPIRAFVKINE